MITKIGLRISSPGVRVAEITYESIMMTYILTPVGLDLVYRSEVIKTLFTSRGSIKTSKQTSSCNVYLKKDPAGNTFHKNLSISVLV